MKKITLSEYLHGLHCGQVSYEQLAEMCYGDDFNDETLDGLHCGQVFYDELALWSYEEQYGDTKYYDRYLAGMELEEDIDDYISEWHDDEETELSLHEYLGMSWEIYKYWLETTELLKEEPNES